MKPIIQQQSIPEAAKYAIAPLIAPDGIDELSESKISLFDAVDDLPEREKLVLAFHYYEGLSFAEIASLLNIAEEEAVKMHAQGLAKLQVLSQEGS
jgi:RNA polymerase sigma factor (sigma-70 family)